MNYLRVQSGKRDSFYTAHYKISLNPLNSPYAIPNPEKQKFSPTFSTHLYEFYKSFS